MQWGCVRRASTLVRELVVRTGQTGPGRCRSVLRALARLSGHPLARTLASGSADAPVTAAARLLSREPPRGSAAAARRATPSPVLDAAPRSMSAQQGLTARSVCVCRAQLLLPPHIEPPKNKVRATPPRLRPAAATAAPERGRAVAPPRMRTCMCVASDGRRGAARASASPDATASACAAAEKTHRQP